MKSITTTIIIVLALGLSGCGKACLEKEPQSCVCPDILDPVCGCNGKTYGNYCEAECYGITKYTKGRCK